MCVRSANRGIITFRAIVSFVGIVRPVMLLGVRAVTRICIWMGSIISVFVMIRSWRMLRMSVGVRYRNILTLRETAQIAQYSATNAPSTTPPTK